MHETSEPTGDGGNSVILNQDEQEILNCCATMIPVESAPPAYSEPGRHT